MDLIEDPEQKQLIFEQKRKQLEDLAREYSLRVEVSKTSIWDKTLYSAWSKIVTQLVPNKEKFEVELEALAEKSGADEGNIINEILKETVKKIYWRVMTCAYKNKTSASKTIIISQCKIFWDSKSNAGASIFDKNQSHFSAYSF